MLRPLLLSALALTAAATASAATLRADPRVSGPAVTLGDVFEDAGAAASRPIAPAPAPGQSIALSAAFLSAAAKSAGLDWTPAPGLTQVVVGRAGEVSARAASARAVSAGAGLTPTSLAADLAIRRGDLVMLVYDAPGLRITTRAKATSDARAGDVVKLVNPQTNKAIDAVATGPGAATTRSMPLS